MKRMITFVLAVILALGCLSLPVHAAETTTDSEVLIISDQTVIKDQKIDTDVYITATGIVTFNNVIVSGDIYCHGQLAAENCTANNVYAYAYGSTYSCGAFDGTHGLITGNISCVGAKGMVIKDSALDYAFDIWGDGTSKEEEEPPKQEPVTEPTTPSEPVKEEKPLGMAPIGALGYQEMTSSQELLDMIKVIEGFAATPFWDYAQYTVGYGCNADQPEGFIEKITPEEAEELLKREMKESYEKYVNNYCRKIGKQPSQNQFDALVSFTYNVGTAWMSGSRVDTWLRNPSTEMEFVNALGQWARAGNDLLFGLAQRRIREAIIFLKGEYSLPYAPTKDHNVKSNLRVISNGALPYYASVVYQYDYDTDSVKKGGGNAIAYFPIGGNYDSLRIPTRDGYMFSGWKITRINGNKTTIGGMVDASTVVEKNLELTALWTEVIPEETQPEDPEETEPEATEPKEEPDDEFVFTDVAENAWYREYVEFVYNNGYMNGISATKFNPQGTMSRAMLVTVLYRMDNEPAVTEQQRNTFEDVESDQYYTDAVAWARANGIVNGISDTQFAPNRNVTRQEAVAILYRFCVEYCGVSGVEAEELDKFLDAREVAAYAVDPMRWAVAVGLINGTTTTDGLCLNPLHNLSRCENAAILMRCVQEILS